MTFKIDKINEWEKTDINLQFGLIVSSKINAKLELLLSFTNWPTDSVPRIWRIILDCINRDS